jgi:hypothetical protein
MDDHAPERLLELQRRFAGHLRDPDNNPPPEGIEERRLAIYRRLFFNNLSNLFARNFPVIRKLFDDSAWRELIRAFMVAHRASTPMFTEIGSEFVAFLVERRDAAIDQRPWLPDLAHWEYLETCVRLDSAEVTRPEEASKVETEALLSARFLINPTLKIAHYQWPVHRISPDFQPETPEPTLLAVYRRGNDRVAFMQINSLTATLLQTLDNDDAPPAGTVLADLADRIDQPVDVIERSALPLLATLVKRELILGTR